MADTDFWDGHRGKGSLESPRDAWRSYVSTWEGHENIHNNTRSRGSVWKDPEATVFSVHVGMCACACMLCVPLCACVCVCVFVVCYCGPHSSSIRTPLADVGPGVLALAFPPWFAGTSLIGTGSFWHQHVPCHPTNHQEWLTEPMREDAFRRKSLREFLSTI